MATVSMARGVVTHATRNGNTAVPYLVERDIDIEKVIEAKGSALADADVIEALSIPKDTVVLMAGIHKTGPHAGTAASATFTVQVGATAYSAAYDFATGAVGTYSVPVDPSAATWTPVTAADTVDLALGMATGTLTEGKLRVFALVLDVSDRPQPGTAPRGG